VVRHRRVGSAKSAAGDEYLGAAKIILEGLM
jgi:hypothetical protein